MKRGWRWAVLAGCCLALPLASGCGGQATAPGKVEVEPGKAITKTRTTSSPPPVIPKQ